MKTKHQRRRIVLGIGSVVVSAFCVAACVARGVEQEEPIGTAQEALTPAEVNARVLGFEGAIGGSGADWVTSAGTIASASTYSQGSKSLSVSGGNHIEVTSRALTTLAKPIAAAVRLDVRLPASSTGQSWKGQVAVSLNAPSVGINNRYLGAVVYTSAFVAGQFKTVSIVLPSDVATILGTKTYSDLTIKLILDLPDATQPTFIDNLVMSAADSGTGVGGAGGGTGTGGAPATGGSNATGGGSQTAFATQMAVQIPSGASLLATALGATDGLVVGDGVVVQSSASSSNADITNTGTAETNVGSAATVNGNVWSVGSVMLRESGTVTRDVNTQGAFGHQNIWHVLGALHQNATLTPPRVYSWTVAFPPPTSSVATVDRETRSLTPGSYSQLSVQPNSTLRLSAGTYYVQRFTAESNSTLAIDASAGPVVLYVRDALNYRGSMTGAGASEFFLGYVGQGLANIDRPFKGTVVAPNAQLRLGPVDGSGQEGSFFGRSVLADARNPIRFVPFAHWDWILPPKLKLECLARSTSEYGAGVFSYENVLDTIVTIPEGPRNNISVDTRRSQGPLLVFAPGVHKNVFWLPFHGPSIQWNLSGTTTTVDDTVRRCTMADYHFEKVLTEDREYLPPLPENLLTQLVPNGTVPPVILPSSTVPALYVPPTSASGSSTNSGASSVVTAAQPLTGEGQRLVRLLFYNLTPGDSCVVGEYDVDAVATVNGTTKSIKLWDGAWTVEAQGVPIMGSIDFFVDPNLTTIDTSFDIWDRHGAICGGDYHEFWSASDFHSVNVASMGPIVGDPNVGYGACGSNGDDWYICVRLQSSFRPKICAEWPVQYAESGFGEDRLPNAQVSKVPASFARVRLNVTGGAAPFTPWPEGSYVVLDQDGCLPPQAAPSAEQLTPANPSFAVTLQWQGALSIPIEGTTNNLVVQVERTRDGDPWSVCGCSGEAFRKYGDDPACASRDAQGNWGSDNLCAFGPGSAQNMYFPHGSMAMVPAIMNGSLNSAQPIDSNGRMMFTFGTDASTQSRPTVFSNTGGFVSQLFQQHATGAGEMGLAPGLIHIWPESVSAFIANTPYEAANGTATERYVEFRPNWVETMPDGSSKAHESDSQRKFVITHEFGHAVQAMAAGNIGNGGYRLTLQDPKSNQMVTVDDPPSLVPECRCAHVGSEFKPAHCMNSLEIVASASGEGFGHFYAARLWNNPNESTNNCWIPYAKWALLPTCPIDSTGHPVKCLTVGAPDNHAANIEDNAYALVDKYYPDQVDRDHMRTKLKDWSFVKGPSLISCADASRWRNVHCTEDMTGKPIATDPNSPESPAINDLGNEMDWMQFYWAVTRETDAWKVSQLFALQKEACGGKLCDIASDCPNNVCDYSKPSLQHMYHAWKTYEALRANPKGALVPPPPPATGGISGAQWLKLENVGREHGVSTDIRP